MVETQRSVEVHDISWLIYNFFCSHQINPMPLIRIPNKFELNFYRSIP